tara:strand:- start:2609 stop:3082 length:474 start_codon:yes stop_codon:yes gene_type:complete
MDISINTIDLIYLTNPNQMKKMKKPYLKELALLKEDLNFYNARILKITKDILKNKEVDIKVTQTFNEYARICIEHFKFIDKKDMIQKEYDLIKKSKSKFKNIDLTKTNEIIFKEKKPKKMKITSQMNIKSNIPPEKIIMPASKIFNLKDPNLKRKGV